MYGVPKFRENFFTKYKKEVVLSVGAFLTIATVVKFVPHQDIMDVKPVLSDRVYIEEVAPIIGYKVVINGAEVGVIETEEEMDGLLASAYEKLVADIGYDPEISADPALIPVREGELSMDTESIVDKLASQMQSTLDSIKQKAYVMRIGDDFTVTLESEDAVKEVLAKAQAYFIKEDVDLEIDIEPNIHNTMVMSPKVLMKSTDESSVSLSTSAQNDNEAITEEIKATKENDTEEAVEPGTMVAIDFAEDIAIVEAYVNTKDIVDIQTATEMITKENEEEKVYLVESGDCPSTIASDNDMKLSELYKMNPGLENKETAIHIGDPIVVMVPEAELKVETKVEIVYTEPIPRETTYTDDPNEYVRSETVIDNGSDGVLEVTALLTKLNGEETDREITSTKVLTESTNKVIAKGSKPFPVKGATGSYIFPVSGYRITSPYGPRWGGFHHGVDLAVSTGTPIHAADGGTILFAGWKSSTYGYLVEIDHGNGVTTRYAHCSAILVVAGQAVSQGETIAKVGTTGRSTGPHVHFEIRFDGNTTDPLNYLE